MLLHGINASWRVWQPVLALLEAHHDVFAPTLPGHLGGPPLVDGAATSISELADGAERLLDAAGIETAHLAGNSLGGWLAIELGRRGRARSLTALSPAGGWVDARDLSRVVRLLSGAKRVLDRHEQLRLSGLIRRPGFRHLAFHGAMEHGERVRPSAALEMIEDAAGCDAFVPFVTWIRGTNSLAPAVEAQGYPIRIAWGEGDRTIPFTRYGQPILDAVSGAEHVTLPGVGHVPMFDDPQLVARTILEVTARAEAESAVL